MQASRHTHSSLTMDSTYHQPVQHLQPLCYPSFQVFNDKAGTQSSQGTQVSFQTYDEQFFTLDSAPAPDYVYNSPPAASVSSSRSPFSPQCSQSYISDMNHSYDNNYGSPFSGSTCGVADRSEVEHALRVIEDELLGPGPGEDDSCSCSFDGATSNPSVKWNRVLEMAPNMDLKQVLFACAEAVSDADISTAELLLDVLEQRVSVSGQPIQRLSAYMLEGLRARLLSSGSIIYKKLKCKEPISSDLMSYMQVLYHICPYIKFAYMTSNAVIHGAVQNENRIHIIDFCIAQGTQWAFFINTLARRPGGPPFLRITGVDDSQSAHARGGGLELVGQKLAEHAKACGVPFEFHAAAISGCEVHLHNLHVHYGEALAVTFPYTLHHMPDESVSTANHRDRLLQLIKSLSPKVVTLIEQESNTNTAPFLARFCETLDYYTAMFESIDAARPRDDKQRINTEEHCVARDIVNMIACEEADRVERHELFGKWRMRFMMAGFSQVPLSPAVTDVMRDVLKEYSSNYRLAEIDGALYLGWKNRALVTSSAWI